METVLINVEKKADIAFLLNLVKRFGMNAKVLSRVETEDWNLAQKIESGMKYSRADRNKVMKALRK